MLCTYRLQQNVVPDEEGTERVVYGVEIIDSVGNVIDCFSDVFFDEEKAHRFVRACNGQGVDPIHLRDLIENALTEQYQLRP